MVINKVKILKILLILSLMVLVLSNLILIFSQKINDNPDEEVHFKAVNYYENNNLPPNFLDEKIIIEEFDLSKNSGEKFVKVYRISDDLNDISDLKLTEKQKCVLEFLKKSEEATVKEINYLQV